MDVECGCVPLTGSMLELSSYGWMTKPSMIRFLRPLARYAAPRSWMKVVGECDFVPAFGSSLPCGDTAPPSTAVFFAAALTASYVCASSASYAGAAASDPSALNCGSQKRGRFGSLPTITYCGDTSRATAAAKAAKS